MSVSAEQDWIEPYTGFEFRETTVVAETDEQARALACCGIDAAVFGDDADPAFFIAHGIQSGEKNGISANGSVNMIQGLTQHAPVPLDTPIAVHGRITAVTPVPRGIVVATDVWFTNDSGDTLITTTRKSLRPDPRKSGERGAGERPAPVVENPLDLETIGAFAFNPDQVKAYNSALNPIHFEPEAAARAGFRAPIIGGGMGVHFFTAAIWQRQRPRAFDLSIYFRRPIFWDDSGRVRVASDGRRWTAFCLEKDDKVATEARINSLEHSASR